MREFFADNVFMSFTDFRLIVPVYSVSTQLRLTFPKCIILAVMPRPATGNILHLKRLNL